MRTWSPSNEAPRSQRPPRVTRMDWPEQACRKANSQKAHSDPTGSRSCGPIISRFGRGVAPSVQRNAIARKAKRAEREDGCSMRIVSFMAYT